MACMSVKRRYARPVACRATVPRIYRKSRTLPNKVRHLIAQAYGLHDYEYMKLKIYELPSMVLRKQLLRYCA